MEVYFLRIFTASLRFPFAKKDTCIMHFCLLFVIAKLFYSEVLKTPSIMNYHCHKQYYSFSSIFVRSILKKKLPELQEIMQKMDFEICLQEVFVFLLFFCFKFAKCAKRRIENVFKIHCSYLKKGFSKIKKSKRIFTVKYISVECSAA